MTPVKTTRYWEDLNRSVGQSWNRFWFTPADPLPLCLLRIAVGLLALSYLVSFSGELVQMFGVDGLMSTATVTTIRGDVAGYDWVHFSLLDLPKTTVALWTLHVLSGLVLVLFTLGVQTRTTSILSLLVILSYIHRQPILTGPFEPVISMLLLYLCLGPCGTYLSVDCWRNARRGATNDQHELSRRDWTTTVSLRLIQLHCAAFYLLMGLSKLSGQVWWEGDAVWLLMFQVRSRPLDLTFLREQAFLLDAWTHAIVAFELIFPLLIWKSLARPLLLGIALVMWSSLAILTGMTGFVLVMLVASAAFLPSDLCWRVLARFPGWRPCLATE
jgi:hypothetical protein